MENIEHPQSLAAMKHTISNLGAQLAEKSTASPFPHTYIYIYICDVLTNYVSAAQNTSTIAALL